MKKRVWLMLPALLLAGCAGDTSSNGDPYLNGGKEGNASLDTNPTYEDDATLKNLFTRISTVSSYVYEVELSLGEYEASFTQYFTEHAWYVDYPDNPNASFGYAETINGSELFKFYVNDDFSQCYPSVYEYGGYDELERLTYLYSSMTVSSVSLLADTLDSLEYVVTAPNTYLVTDGDSMSVFQYMTTYGSSITNYINACYVRVVDEESNEFEVDLDLGVNGNIYGHFYIPDSNPISMVNEAVLDGLTGIATQSVVEEACEVLEGNNFTLTGYKEVTPTGTRRSPYKIYCTPNYFYFEYQDGFNYESDPHDFGYAFIPAGTTVPVTENGNVTQYTVDYDACYSYVEDDDGNLYFDSFFGPVTPEGTSYLNVDSLPATGEVGILYIVPEGGIRKVYEWIETTTDGVTTGYFNYYSDWYESVGEFMVYDVNLMYGTFYPSATAFTGIAPMMMERVDRDDENETNFVSTSIDVEASLAYGILGVGYQGTTTWMDYIDHAFMNVTYDEGDVINGIELGLSVETLSGAITHVSYDFSDFGTTTYQKAVDFLGGYL